MKHERGLKTLCQHLRVFSRLKIILH
ncbi:hypothetical protein Gotur_019018 [Gossypium turneri]